MSASSRVTDTPQALAARRQTIEFRGRRSGGVAGRISDDQAVMNGGLYGLRETMGAANPAWADNIARWYLRVRDADLLQTHAFADVPRNRSNPHLAPGYVHIVERRPDGIVLSCADLWSPRNFLFWEVALLVAIPLAVGAYGGLLAGLLTLVAQVIAKFFLEALNYLQHYGLVRAPGSATKLHHTWNHLGWIDRTIGYEITTHIDPDLRFDQLIPHPDASQMPNLFMCAVSAFVPPLWFKYVAMPRLKDRDLHHASPAEQAIAREANRKAGWPDWLNLSGDVASGATSHV